jgi:hypothetical protein
MLQFLDCGTPRLGCKPQPINNYSGGHGHLRLRFQRPLVFPDSHTERVNFQSNFVRLSKKYL